MNVDDILREIDETSQDHCAAEIERLKRKRRGYKASFTQILNIIDALLKASVQDNQINKSETNPVIFYCFIGPQLISLL